MPFDGTMLPQAARDLLAAKRYIEEHGWCSHGPRREETVCMVLGLEIVTRNKICAVNKRHNMAGNFLMRAIGSKERYRILTFAKWNDTPGRTLDEVYATFDRAIALAIEEEGMPTLGDALPREMARVRDEVMPSYVEIRPPGVFALTMMRADLDTAAKALAEGDVIEMLLFTRV